LVETRATTGIQIWSCSPPLDNEKSLLVSLTLTLRFKTRGRISVWGELRLRLDGPDEAGPDKVAMGVERSFSTAWWNPKMCQWLYVE
jgi:hypothetical protein